jgi:5-methylcytosine-specific restriction endonuclease McrA
MRSTLLLTQTYEPLDIIPWQEAIRLLTLGKCEVVEEYEDEIRSTYLILKMPAVVRLLKRFRKHKKPVKFSRINVYARDKFCCQYCNKKGTTNDLTFDHVIPRARGGKTNWENIVACCVACNSKKNSKTPAEAGMKLKTKPVCPEWLPAVVIKISQKNAPQAWRDYLFWTVELDE